MISIKQREGSAKSGHLRTRGKGFDKGSSSDKGGGGGQPKADTCGQGKGLQ